ncbi:hypothetical protein ACFW53_25700 [Nocardiopsis dassonvillei]|uniref:hypothetical protein n=1 Tax=Nocardiopsis dassonvillei TaxID=2014 RepID=UPI00366F5626
MSSLSKKIDWEILTLRETTTLRTMDPDGSPRTESRTTDNCRVRVVRDGRMGDSFSRTGARSLEDQLAEAMAASRFGPLVSIGLGENYPSERVDDSAKENNRIPSTNGLLRSITEERFLCLRSSSGASVQWSASEERLVYGSILGELPVPVACVGTSNREPVVPDIEVRAVRPKAPMKTPWMFGPLAVAELFGRTLEDQIIRGSQLDRPRGVRVLDDGSGGYTDFEGTRRQSLVWSEDGTPCVKGCTFQDASDSTQLTSHGGMDGFRIQNLTVVPYKTTYFTDPVIMIIGARPLSFSQTHFLLTAMDGKLYEHPSITRIIVQCTTPNDFLSCGTWSGLQQYGNGSWNSPWFILHEPAKFFQVFDVQQG